MNAMGQRKGRRLDRLAFAKARARGEPLHVAAKAAGSRATSVESLMQGGVDLEGDPEVREMIRAERAKLHDRAERSWDVARARAEQVLNSDAPWAQKMWRHAWDFLAKIGGHYAPEKHEHSHSMADVVAELAAKYPTRFVAGAAVVNSAPSNGHVSNGNGNGKDGTSAT